MPSAPDWNQLATSLRGLHRTLMERARSDYEKERGVELGAGQLLGLLVNDPYFAWLRALSEVMVEVDMIAEGEDAVKAEAAGTVRGVVENLLAVAKPGDTTSPFSDRFWPYVREDPHIAMALADVKRALQSWPVASFSLSLGKAPGTGAQ
jgi:hypothetical protein